MAPVVWHGNQTEALILQDCIQHNCQCEFKGPDGKRTKTCAPHLAMSNDQHFMDGLVFARRMAALFQQEEFSTK